MTAASKPYEFAPDVLIRTSQKVIFAEGWQYARFSSWGKDNPIYPVQIGKDGKVRAFGMSYEIENFEWFGLVPVVKELAP